MSGGLWLTYPNLDRRAFRPPPALPNFLKPNAHFTFEHIPQRSLVGVALLVTQDYYGRWA